MNKIVAVIATIGIVALPATTRAAVATFQSGSDLYTLNTGQSGGSCNVTHLATGGVDIDCHDAVGNRAYGNTLEGCLITSHSGECYYGMPLGIDASTTTKCGTTKYVTGTGNSQGSCTPTFSPDGNSTGSDCDDGAGNRAVVDCTKNGGQGACGTVTGSGTCTMPPN